MYTRDVSGHGDEAWAYYLKAKGALDVSQANRIVGYSNSPVGWTLAGVVNTGAGDNEAARPGMPTVTTGATASSSAHFTWGTALSGRNPCQFVTGKKGYFAARFALSTIDALAGAYFSFMDQPLSVANAHIGAIGSVDAVKFCLINASGSVRIQGPDLDTADHIAELYWGSGGTTDFRVDGVSYGGNASIQPGTSVLRYRVDNGATAAARRVRPRWAVWAGEF